MLVQCFTVLVHEREEIAQERAALHVRLPSILLALIARLTLPFSLYGCRVPTFDGSDKFTDFSASVRQVQLTERLLGRLTSISLFLRFVSLIHVQCGGSLGLGLALGVVGYLVASLAAGF